MSSTSRPRSRTFGPALIALFLFGAAAFLAQPAAATGEWSQLAPTSPPQARRDFTMILDAGNNRLVLFGGRTSPASGSPVTHYADTWVFSLATLQWSLFTTSGAAPSARGSHTAIYDPGRPGVAPRMLVLGGEPASDQTVYALSLTGTPTWSTLTTSGGPPVAKRGHVAIYDSHRDQMVITAGAIIEASTWALSLATLTWTELQYPSSPGLFNTTSAYDPVNQRMLVFGGVYYVNGTCPTTNVGSHNSVMALELDNTPPNWVELPPAPWDPRIEATAVLDGLRNRILVFGGAYWTEPWVCVAPFCGGCTTRAVVDTPSPQLWAYSLGAGTWTNLTPASAGPAARARHGAAYYPTRDELLIFGGGDISASYSCGFPACSYAETHTYLSDTWRFYADGVAPAATTTLWPTAGCYDHIDLTWEAPGDDGTVGTATAYDLRWSNAVITAGSFASATPISVGPPSAGGMYEELTVGAPCSPKRYYALKTRDEAGNWSALSNVVSVRPSCPKPPIQCHDFAHEGIGPREAVPTALSLAPPLPNPSQEGFEISYAIPEAMRGQAFELAAFDLVGRRVATIERGRAEPGTYSTRWDMRSETGEAIKGGVYFLRLKVGTEVLTRRVIAL